MKSVSLSAVTTTLNGKLSSTTKEDGQMEMSDPSDIKQHFTLSTTTSIAQVTMQEDVIIIGSTTYVELAGTRKYTKVSTPMKLSTPAEALSRLKTATKSATYQGNETVGGIVTSHYALVVNPAAFITNPPKGVPLPDTMSCNIWVDAGNVPIKTSTAFGSNGETISTVTTYDKYNQPVTISAPE